VKKCIDCLGITRTITLVGYFAIAFSTARTLAQIAPDNTLGAESSIVTPNANVGGSLGDRIDGGATRGANLFHSFLEFNVGNGQGVYFANPTGIQNIFSRVTGTNPSQIRGTLGVDGGANLFLLNPNGIIFGRNARLEIAGSLVATTANSLLFENGFEFSTRNPQAPPLLTINLSPGLQYGSNRSGTISNTGNLAVGQNLTLAAGNLNLQGQLQAGGDLTLTSLSGDISVSSIGTSDVFGGGSVTIDSRGKITVAGEIDVSAQDLSLNNTYRGNGGNVTLLAKGDINLTRGSGILSEGLLGGNITLKSDAAIYATNSEVESVSSTNQPGLTGGNINVSATSLFLSNATLSTTALRQANGGSVIINATDSVSVTNGAGIGTVVAGQGNAGDVKINATNSVSLDGVSRNGQPTTVGSGALPRRIGNGNISITTGSLSITNGALISTATLGRGDAGSVKINATNSVSLDGASSNGQPSSIFSATATDGKGGPIEIETGSLSVTNGAGINASTVGRGDAGSVKINATNSVSLDGASSNGQPSGIFSATATDGKGGPIEIETGSLSVTNGAVISASTGGQKDAGNVKITATNSVSLDGVSSNGGSSGIVSGSAADGNGGLIEIETGSLSVTNGAGISATTGGQGNAGNVKITATNAVSLDGVSSNGQPSGIQSDVYFQADGEGGTIEIETGSLSVTNGAVISASTVGQGNAGNVKITQTNAVSLDGVSSNGEPSGIFSLAAADGKGGSIEIETGSLSVTNSAQINASTVGQEEAGSIHINAREDVRISGDSLLVTASFSSGEGGDIDIKQARSLFLMDGAQITSQSVGTGAAGNITIHTRENLESDRSQITATTQSGDGGNINLTVGDLLLMRNNSQISTTAGNAQAGGNGGNININTPFLVAVPIENSDITANAFTGTGGTVNITFAGIYGLEFRPRQTPKSDITASSEYGPQGTFEVSDLTGIKAEQGLTNLPTEPVDRSRQIVQKCRSSGATAREKNQFIITGRGGLPPSPNEPLQSEAVTTNWVTLDSDIDNKTTPAATTPPSSTPKQLVEAQGWIIDDNGEIVLTTQAPTVTPQGEWFSAADCNMPQG